jgi:hypothetical protein
MFFRILAFLASPSFGKACDPRAPLPVEHPDP